MRESSCSIGWREITDSSAARVAASRSLAKVMFHLPSLLLPVLDHAETTGQT